MMCSVFKQIGDPEICLECVRSGFPLISHGSLIRSTWPPRGCLSLLDDEHKFCKHKLFLIAVM